MKVFLAALILIGIGVAGMCFNIIFRNKAFPQTDVGSNDNMKKMGIRCMREEDDERFSKEERSDLFRYVQRVVHRLRLVSVREKS